MRLPSLVCLALSLAAPTSAQQLDAVLLATGLNKPTQVVDDPTLDGRLFVVERNRGIATLIDGQVQPTRFLDLAAEVGSNTQGIMGMALHPDYANNGRLFIVYTDRDQDSHLVEYQRSTDPNVADPASRIQILGPVLQPGTVHNWNQVLFGPDGMLYLTTGDGVLSSDTTVNNAQHLGTLFGKVLRLDMDLPPPYVPSDNPFFGQPGARPQVWLYGVRQPWRSDFDPLTGDFWLTDVGNQFDEEVNVLPAGTAAGANLGWECQVGRDRCLNGVGCVGCEDQPYVDAAWEYQHLNGRCSIIGGAVYRGSAIPWMQGKFVYTDYCTGELWSVRHDNGRIYDWVQHGDSAFHDDLQLPCSIDRLNNGELVICDQVGGDIFQLVAGTSCGATGALLACQTTTNSSQHRGTLGATGSLSIGDNDLTLHMGNLPSGDFGYMLMGRNAGMVPMFGGSQGTLCLSSPIIRFPDDTLLPDPDDGTVVFQPDLDDLPGATVIQPGESWIFQYWFRDSNPTPTSNTSDALVVTFCN